MQNVVKAYILQMKIEKKTTMVHREDMNLLINKGQGESNCVSSFTATSPSAKVPAKTSAFNEN